MRIAYCICAFREKKNKKLEQILEVRTMYIDERNVQ